MSRVVIVSNRVPVPAGRKAQAGGLAVALRDAVKPGSLWFGWSGRTAAQTSENASVVEQGGVQYATIDLSHDDYRNFYVGFANGVLWPLLHFRLGLIEFRREHLEGYRAVNEMFAKVLAKLLEPDDVVWVHDYHLIPLADELRKLGAENRMGFFLHIPFVPASVFAALPQGGELLNDFCAYDVIGFQTVEHQRDFLDSVRIILRHQVDSNGEIAAPRSTIRCIVTPIGIDSREFQHVAEHSARSKTGLRLKDSLVGRKLMIGADRLDYSKGLPNRFEAFHRLLTRFPEHRMNVSFLQIAAPSREEVSEYAALRPVLNRLAGDINARHGAFDWVPLRYMSQGFARSTLAGFYRIARVGVVTPLRDGMNLVAHEYIAAQDRTDPGVLVLSRFAGASSYFDDALVVNPYDPDEIAEAMHEALLMGANERRRRHTRLFERLLSLTVESYCTHFLEALLDCTKSRAAA
ncbi:MAG: trehalose-6-phosphate synthase [Alphaproteobacteria bacterium]|nr:trehalose-6-phosphate synthase [Alphaproteobacteria bacterium]